MMQCPKCGYTNQDDSRFCTGCGAPLTSPEIPQQPKPKRHGLMIAILCIVLVAAIGIGAAVWLMNSQPEDRLMSAMEKTNEALGDLYGQNKNLAAIGKNFKKLVETKECSMTFGVSDSYNQCSFEAHAQNNTAICNMDYNLSGTALNLSFYFDQDQMQIAAPDYLDEVYGFPLENLEENLKNSWIGQNMDVSVPENFEELRKSASPYQEELDAILDSVTTEKLDPVELTLGDATQKCDAYRVSCDAETILNFINVLNGENFGISEVSPMLPYDDSDLQAVIQELDSIETTMYVDNRGYWVGMDILKNGDGAQLRLAGTNNPCQTISFTLITDGEALTMNFISNVTEDDVELILENETIGEQVSFLHYSKDGTLSIMPGTSDEVQFLLAPVDGGVELSLSDGDTSVLFGMYALKEKVAPLADTYTNLLEMDENDFMELIASVSGY